MEVVSQANDSSNATINLAKTDIAYINAAQNGLEVNFTVTDGNNSNVESSKTLTVNKPTIYTPPTSDKSSGGGSINLGLLALLLIWDGYEKI